MRRAVLALLLFSVSVVPSYVQKTQAANQGRAAAIAQMRGIASAMKACPEEVRSQTELATYYAGPPTNLEWDVKNAETARSPFQGIVTFTLPERSDETEKAKRSKKLHKQYMDMEIYKAAYGHDGHYEYDFDLGNGKPELMKVLFVDDKTKESKAVPSGVRGSTCWDKVARSDDR